MTDVWVRLADQKDDDAVDIATADLKRVVDLKRKVIESLKLTCTPAVLPQLSLSNPPRTSVSKPCTVTLTH
jgi:hypothetical protein